MSLVTLHFRPLVLSTLCVPAYNPLMSLRPVPGNPMDRQLLPKGALFSVLSLHGPMQTFRLLSCDHPVCSVATLAPQERRKPGAQEGERTAWKGLRGWVGWGAWEMNKT